MEIKNIIEVLIYSSTKPVSSRDLQHAIGDYSLKINQFIDEINKDYQISNKGLKIEKISGGFQILSNPEYHPYIEKLNQSVKRNRFSMPSIETLSIIAYKQPITKSEIEHIRGVSCSGIMKKLLDNELISIKGRDKGIGRALLYITTPFFLEVFGLDSIKDLPTLKELSQLIDNGTDATKI